MFYTIATKILGADGIGVVGIALTLVFWIDILLGVGIGLALVLGVVISYFIRPSGNPSFLFLGMGIVLGAIFLALAATLAARIRNRAAGNTQSQEQTMPGVKRTKFQVAASIGNAAIDQITPRMFDQLNTGADMEVVAGQKTPVPYFVPGAKLRAVVSAGGDTKAFCIKVWVR